MAPVAKRSVPLAGRRREFGRTMVEILAVLAIIGVLSILALLGYGYAVRYYRANEILGSVNIERTAVFTQYRNNSTFTPSEGRIAGMYDYKREVLPDDDGFVVNVENVSGDVCASVLQRRWDAPSLYLINGARVEDFNADPCFSGGENASVRMGFVFFWDGAGRPVSPGNKCDDDFKCRTNGDIDERQVVIDSDTGKCLCLCQPPNDMYDTDTGACECPGPAFTELRDGKCVCPGMLEPDASESACVCPKHLPVRTDSNMCVECLTDADCTDTRIPVCYTSVNMCGRATMQDQYGDSHNCATQAIVYVNGVEGNCADCPNRVLYEKGDPDYRGSACVLPCPEATPLMDLDENCHACDKNQLISVANKNICETLCPEGTGPYGGRRWFRGYLGYCMYACPEGYFFGIQGCFPCDQVTEVNTTWHEYNSGGTGLPNECSYVCNGSSAVKRIGVWLGGNVGYCGLETCPGDRPLRNLNGGCYPCSTTSIDQGLREDFRATCAACTDAAGNRTHVLVGSVCRAGVCPALSALDGNGVCVCQEGYTMVDNSCRNCDDPAAMKITEAECNACGNRRVWWQTHAGYLCLKTRADDEFYSQSGTYNCDDPGRFVTYTKGADCAVCDGQNGRAKRVGVGGLSFYCVLPCDEPDVSFMGNNATCYPCNTSQVVGVKNENPDDGYDNVYKTCYEQCPGQRAKFPNSADCMKCPLGTYSAVKDTCAACPADAGTLTRRGDCIACNGSWNAAAGTCVGCPAGEYNASSGCTLCPETPGDLSNEYYCLTCNYQWDEVQSVCVPRGTFIS
ncbi:MAG: type II secretion system protein [Alphaproteobacteria bacterium]|nr:type II secretion system protein [Alphaproteobacteria bacterium]